MMIGFGGKAGMFPLHGWLPTAHPVAPSPASAVLSGIITKGGVLAIIRVAYYLFGAEFLKGTWVQKVLLVLAMFALGIIIGFFSIAKLMKLLLSKFPRGTNWSIIGFVIGSIPAIFITYNSNFPDFVYSSLNTAHIAIGAVLCVLGIIGSYALTAYVEAKNKSKAVGSETPSPDEPQE